MNIFITGPSSLTELDQKEVIDNLEDFVNNGHDIFILAYRSLELEVFKYFINKLQSDSSIANKLHIFSFQPPSLLPEKIKISIDYLTDLGSNYTSFNQTPSLVNGDYFIKRDAFISNLEKIITNCDLIVSFYDNKKSSLMIPIDVATKLNKKSIVYYLPNDDLDFFELPAESKMKIFNSN